MPLAAATWDWIMRRRYFSITRRCASRASALLADGAYSVPSSGQCSDGRRLAR